MWSHFRLQATVPGEPAPVTVALQVTADDPYQFRCRVHVVGARTLRSPSSVSVFGDPFVMEAGASFAFDHVRLSNGFNVVDPPPWRGQGLGTLAFNSIIAWASRHHPVCAVRPVELRYYNGAPIAAADRRKRFCERFGLSWSAATYRPDHRGSWNADETTVAELRQAQLPPSLSCLPL